MEYPQLQQLQQMEAQLKIQMEARKAGLIAEFMEDYSKAEKETLNQVENDPLLKLKAREVDLRAMENERKKDNDIAQQDLARARLMQQGDIADEKLDQNEKLAKLRAGVSLAKSGNQGITAIKVED